MYKLYSNWSIAYKKIKKKSNNLVRFDRRSENETNSSDMSFPTLRFPEDQHCSGSVPVYLRNSLHGPKSDLASEQAPMLVDWLLMDYFCLVFIWSTSNSGLPMFSMIYVECNSDIHICVLFWFTPFVEWKVTHLVNKVRKFWMHTPLPPEAQSKKSN